MDKKRIVLDNRLNTLAEVLGRCPVYADIGCDHGRLGAFLIQRGWVEKAILTDISADSLMKARTLIRLLGFEDRVEFLVCNGLPVCEKQPEAYVIAGMGGVLISDILKSGMERLNGARLILQANVAIPQLRQTLFGIGYRITHEELVQDGRRFYLVIEAIPGEAEYDEKDLIIGPVLRRTVPALFENYAAFRIRVLEKALAGAEQGNDREEAESIRKELAIWKEAV